MKRRLDTELVRRGLVQTRSQAENYIKLGMVYVDNVQFTKPGHVVSETTPIRLDLAEQYVSRAALKLASVAERFKLDFRDKVVLDVGSSTGGFTDYALQHGAKKVIAVDVGTDQLHPSLRAHQKVELHEQTDIRNFNTEEQVDIVVADVSFISLRDVLPHVSKLMTHNSRLVAMVKPQFEAGTQYKHKGVVKNERIRRDILKEFEAWVAKYFLVIDKADSKIAGSKGNLERFYLFQRL